MPCQHSCCCILKCICKHCLVRSECIMEKKLPLLSPHRVCFKLSIRLCMFQCILTSKNMMVPSPSSSEVIFLIELDKCFFLESSGKGIFSDICTFHGLLNELVPIMRSHGTGEDLFL